MSFSPRIARYGPYILNQQAGEKKYWCSCGLSSFQPFCDGSHANEDTGMSPIGEIIDLDGEKSWCGCKKTKNPPYCDGSHKKL